jgi:hypothetical protein
MIFGIVCVGTKANRTYMSSCLILERSRGSSLNRRRLRKAEVFINTDTVAPLAYRGGVAFLVVSAVHVDVDCRIFEKQSDITRFSHLLYRVHANEKTSSTWDFEALVLEKC